MAGVDNLVRANELLPLLRVIGYDDVTPEPGDQEWYYCLSKAYGGDKARVQNFHLHLMKFRSVTWERHIIFRDFLRTHSNVAQKYEQLKRKMAAKYGSDREGYTNSKTEFIKFVVNQARLDQRKGWSLARTNSSGKQDYARLVQSTPIF